MSAIRQHTIDSGLPGPHLLITAGVHGDEFEPMVAAHRLVNIAGEKIKRGKLTIVPIVNHSAFTVGERCGEDRLDVARICPGNLSGSISEKTAFEISSLIRTADYYVDLHNGGKLFDILALAGYMLHPNKQILHTQRQMAKAFSLVAVWGTDVAPNGRTLSVARDANVPAIYVEFGGASAFNSLIMQTLIDGCIRVIAFLGLYDEQPVEKNGPTYIVEDNEKDGGYLQVKMQSPADGIFIPAVALGDRVEAGDRWGIICDPITCVDTEVRADKDGIVFFLRAFPKVLRGDSLGGILVAD